LFPPGKLQLQFSLVENKQLHRSPQIALIDAKKAPFPLTIRNWKKGDSFQPFGMQGHKKLSDYWIDKKVPRAERKRIPLVFKGDQLIWIAGYTIDDHFKVTNQTRSVLKIEMVSTNV
jgi:tRNA(Ile)-lysidine synthase